MSVNAVIQKKDGSFIMVTKHDWDDLFTSEDVANWQTITAVLEDD